MYLLNFSFGWLVCSLSELMVQLFLYFFQMINKENRNSYLSNFEEEHLVNQPRKQSERDLRSEVGEWANTIQIDNSNHLFASELQFLAQGSLRTISCRSLDISPEVNIFRPFKDNMDGEIYLPKNTSENSIFEEEQDRQAQNQRNLISETRQLILSDQSEDSQSEMSTRKSRPLIKNHSRTLSARIHKVCKISKIKHLRRNMRKLLSKGVEEVQGNFMLKGDKSDVVVLDGMMTVLMSQKGVIGSLLIRKGEQEIFLKIKNSECPKEDIKVESWDRQEEKWLSFTLHIDLTPK